MASQEFEQLKREWKELQERIGGILDEIGQRNMLDGIRSECTDALDVLEDEIEAYMGKETKKSTKGG